MRREKCVTTLQSDTIPCSANNGQPGIGFLRKRKWKDPIMRVKSISHRVAELGIN